MKRPSPISSRGICSAVLLLAVCGSFGGCQRSVLVNKNDPRTQFETYDRMRQQYTPLEVPDAFGTPQPALRARLSPQS
ncbi:MAG: hypothetical protein EXS00_06960 [Phycisphaerales bacterium]|nr:hypothetical protein [Phycisphaerales bacterium]